jgi:predicted NAD-dependent protein-ADP-ribosyltransferase YbiA (DUF1768 family)
MVVSVIKPEITYNESKKINEEDRGYKSRIYEIDLLNKIAYIALGKIKYTFTGKDVLYYLVYLIREDTVVSQIGVIEIESKQMSSLLDSDGYLDLSEYANTGGNILLYQHVNVDFLNAAKSALPKTPVPIIDIVEPEPEPEPLEESVFLVQESKSVARVAAQTDTQILEPIPNADIPEMLREETKADADKLKNPNANTYWVQRFMKNDNFRVHSVPGDGDCFFSVIRDAFKQAGLKTTVTKLRQLVADNLTQGVFEQYMALYGMYANEVAENVSKIKRIKETVQDLKSRYNKVTEKSDKEKLLALIEEQREDAKTFAKYKAIADDEQMHFIFMRDVKSLGDLQNAVLKSDYWADEVALSIIENKLNVKLIILSQENFDNGSEDTVMVCNTGTTVNPAPEYYIMTSYTGNHYDLISYKEKKIFKFSEIPYYIKTLIVNKCVEHNAGAFHHITDFRNFQTNFGIDPVSNSYESEPVLSELYDDTVQFMFYAASADAKPGKGSGEKMDTKDAVRFKDLVLVPNWRRKLDDTFIAPFTYDNKRWQTVEHYYQASKFKKGFPDFYAQFSMDSESEISADVKKAKGAGGKTGRYEKELLRPRDVKLDSDFYGGRDRVERANALMAKFEQNSELKSMLLHTLNAKLLHFVRGSEPEMDTLLMETRKKLKV